MTDEISEPSPCSTQETPHANKVMPPSAAAAGEVVDQPAEAAGRPDADSDVPFADVQTSQSPSQAPSSQSLPDAAEDTSPAAAAADAADPAPTSVDTACVDTLPPDHPLLRRAQEALHKQLSEQKLRLDEELRERRKALKDAKQQRESAGVELYGFQQHLAQLQLSLEQASDEHAAAAAARSAADDEVDGLRTQVAREEKAAAARHQRVDALQKELDRLAVALRAIQAHNEGVASELAAAQRQTYATEGQVQALEVVKQRQDFLIDNMQQKLRRLHRQAALQADALQSQRAETAAAREYIASTLRDLEAVTFEKKQLLAQWRASLVAMQQRDAALEGLHSQLRQQAEQQALVTNEAQGCRRQLAQQRQRNEAAKEVVARLEAQAGRLAEQVERVRARQEKLQESHATMHHELAARQHALATAASEHAKVAAETAAAERQQANLVQQLAAVEQLALEKLGEQTFAEKGAQGVVRDIAAARAAILEKESAAEQLRATLSKLQAQVAFTEGAGNRQAAALQELEHALADRSTSVAALETQMKAVQADVEAKTRQLELLNRRYQKLVESSKDVETGPLEATLANLQREIAAKEDAARDLQRRWIGMQSQLVAAQASNAESAEEISSLRTQQGVMEQKRARLNRQLEAQATEAKALSKALASLRTDTARLNALLADATGQRSALHEGNVALESKLCGELQVLEQRWLRLSAAIEALRAERAQVVAAVVEADREVLVWERRVQLEREMQDAVDPAYGSAELTAARKEAARLSHAAARLAGRQEALVGELERVVEKREAISTKAQLSQSKKVQEMTATQARRAADELARALGRADKEGRACDARLEQLGGSIQAAKAAAEAASEQCTILQAERAGVTATIQLLGQQRHRALVGTSLKQREARRYEDALAGRYKSAVLQAMLPAAPHAASAAAVPAAPELLGALAADAEKARSKQERIRAAVEGVAAEEPAAAGHLQCALAHVAALAE